MQSINRVHVGNTTTLCLYLCLSLSLFAGLTCMAFSGPLPLSKSESNTHTQPLSGYELAWFGSRKKTPLTPYNSPSTPITSPTKQPIQNPLAPPPPTGIAHPPYTSPIIPPPVLDEHLLETLQVSTVDNIRVGISDDRMENMAYPETIVSASSPFQIVDKATGNVIFNGQTNQGVRVTVNAQGFLLNGSASAAPQPGLQKPFNAHIGPLLVQSQAPQGMVKLLNVTRKGNTPSYRGVFEIVRAKNSSNQLTVINILPMQDYLKAVVPNELPMSFGLEAVKAQSVAARNYALRPRERPWHEFDICDSQYCQAYYGMQTETFGTSKALDTTNGLLALYGGEPVLALYSSSHGGYGESYSNAFADPKSNQFPGLDLPYLRGGADLLDVANRYGDLRVEENARRFWTDPQIPSFDVLSSLYRWNRNWDRVTLETTLNQTLKKSSTETKAFVQPNFTAGDTVGQLKQMNVLQRGISGKVMALEIIGTGGRWVVTREYVIRKVLAMGGKMLPSANFVITPATGPTGLMGIRLDGGGFGHGVGMSQYGASYMSKHGHDFVQILQHYYKGSAIGSMPLTIKGTSYNSKQALKTEFNVPPQYGRQAILKASVRMKPCTTTSYTGCWTQPPPPVAIAVKLNQEIIYLTLKPSEASTSVETSWVAELPIGNLIQPGQTNALILYPPGQLDSNQLLSAWVEIAPGNNVSP